MRPDLGRKVFDQQTYQKARYYKISKGREFTLGKEALVQNFRGEPKWLDTPLRSRPVPFPVKF